VLVPDRIRAHFGDELVITTASTGGRHWAALRGSACPRRLSVTTLWGRRARIGFEFGPFAIPQRGDRSALRLVPHADKSCYWDR